MLINPLRSPILRSVDIVKQKIKQAGAILDELDIDIWLLFVRETGMQADPAMPLVVGNDDCTWQSVFAYTRTGKATALVGNFDRDIYTRHGRFDEVLTYTQGVKQDINRLLDRLKPSSIALNYSTSNPAADGLTYGMYQLLCEYLDGSPYRDCLVSAESLLGKLRSRKTPMETQRLEAASVMATDVWRGVVKKIDIGMTEIEVGALIDNTIREMGGTASFPTIVNAGDKTSPGHGHPTEARLEAGDLLHVDFGVRLDDYCSDIQRLVYFTRPGESGPSPELVETFETVRDIITETGVKCRPGVQGHEVDALARRILADNGYEEYQHALGHQLGRAVHDGGALIGPKWERYGPSPSMEIEETNVFTLELEIMLPGIGCCGLEEDVSITKQGARFLCPRQLELIVK